MHPRKEKGGGHEREKDQKRVKRWEKIEERIEMLNRIMMKVI
jgi:hypothetical protein